MDVVYERCCGIDVHKKNVVVCVLTPEHKEIRTFATMTEDLLAMVSWIQSYGCTHIAMESTASFWKPIYNLLEMAEIQTLVVNAKHMKNVPGRKTEQVLAEIGTNMEQFPTAAHLCSWAGLAPGNNESAGKRKSGKTRKGNQKLRAALVEAARAAARTKETYLSSQYRRIAGRRGANRAAVAVAHSILTIVYHLLSKRQPYKELGATYFEERKKNAVVKQSIRRLEALGYEVTTQPVA